MKTFTFYSYKGGVGRTLALVNVANRLAEFGKKVCILDFDLEAPGLQSKYAKELQQPIDKGLVDYIYSYAVENVQPRHISDYIVDIHLTNAINTIHLCAAGDVDSSDYWKKLARINWWNLFYAENSYGIDFFLNLKKQIEEELAPDFLLIDSRTGITEMSAITMSLLADDVVFLAANNEENIKGCCKVLNSLSAPENNLLGIKRTYHFVLTRIPLPDSPDEKVKHNIIVEQKTNIIKECLAKNGITLESVNVIHSDRCLEENELCNISYIYEVSKSSSAKEYMALYDSLVKNYFSKEDLVTFDGYKQLQLEVDKALRYYKENDTRFIEQAEMLIEKYPKFSYGYSFLSNYYYARFEFQKALEFASKATDTLGPELFPLQLKEVYLNFLLGNYRKSETLLNKIYDEGYEFAQFLKIQIEHALYHNEEKDMEAIARLIKAHPDNAIYYNEEAAMYNFYKKYDKALESVNKAFEIDSELDIVYITLAEIKYRMNEKLDFYRNLELALKYNYDLRWMKYDEMFYIYKECLEDERFLAILDKYDVRYIISFWLS
ncbi:AAA family ATPase [uncultured Bacteroides sp.]|uniref:KGGVGR-motif variant AAA ATPase n=1 Tax=uncultured Bacteroides sp. TaxID=162156 RepID=UPI0025DCEBBC|nr:AAA family ATPase [uncultured Bacteroides sp.]